MASSFGTSSRKTLRAAVRMFIRRASASPSEAAVVRESMKYIPGGSAPRTADITRRSAVAREPMWLFTPRACGTAATFARVAAAIWPSVMFVNTAPGPGETRGKSSGSIGRWQRTSKPRALSSFANVAALRLFGRTEKLTFGSMVIAPASGW